MRAINIKNIHHLPIYYVLLTVLLLYCSGSGALQLDNKRTELLNNASKQQQKLLDSYGLNKHKPWQQKCNDMITTLKLTRFKQCLIIDASFANAYSLAHGVIILTAGLLTNIKNDDQLAHIMAHEHAHLRLNHHQQAQQLVEKPPKLFTKSRIKKFYRKIEQQADQTANQTLLKFDFEPLQIHHYLLRIEQSSKEYSNDHQKLKHRIQRNGLPEEIKDPFWQGIIHH